MLNPLIKRVVCREGVEQKCADGRSEKRTGSIVRTVKPAMEVGCSHEWRRPVIGARHAMGIRLSEESAMKTDIAGRCLQETKKESPSLSSIRSIEGALVASDGMDSPAIRFIDNSKARLHLMIGVPYRNQCSRGQIGLVRQSRDRARRLLKPCKKFSECWCHNIYP